MKRKNISKACGSMSRNEEAEAGQVEIQHSGCSIVNLPSHILATILFRLPIKNIIVCKCICKSLYATLSNPEFAKMHYAQSEVLPIARTVNCSTHVSRTLYPLELEQDERYMDMFSCQQSHDYSERIHQVCMKTGSKLKIPVRNFPIDGNEAIALNPMDHKYKVVNSCNGFLCLSEPIYNKPVVVCNPVTGEFIDLPQVIKGENDDGFSNDYFDCGFGFSPKTNQYKVVKLLKQYSPLEHVTIRRKYTDLVQVHILGTRSWKNIEFSPYSGYMFLFPTYLNGAVHWICLLVKKLILILSFDCEKECFHPFPSPPLREGIRDNVGMGVLGGCLCICDSSDPSLTCVWVMKNYGVETSWTKVFEIDVSYCGRMLYGLYQPIKYMNNGALLMFNYPSSVLIYYDPRNHGLKLFELRPSKSKFEILAHTPSLISLKDVLAGCKVEVVNVYSRCAGLKLKGEAKAISLYWKTNLTALSDSNCDLDYEFYLYNYTHQDLEEYWWGKFDYRFSMLD
ncbi:F-box protein At3g07870-like [Euphorbia lathyris]|uniref:F-box protein At3g07870-like n=1 Tax=Euphorbia lathyris TaxID=212925 RepID=UPI003313AD55